MKNTKRAVLMIAFACLAGGGGGLSAAEVKVDNVTDLTNKIATIASGSTIYLAKGRYDVSDCRGNLMGGYDKGLLGIPNGKYLTFSGAPGTVRGDVVIDAPDATNRLLYINKGSLTCTNLTFAGSAGGAINVGNADAKIYLYDCVFSNLTADVAAAVSRSNVCSANGATSVANCLFVGCVATNGDAGACRNLGEVTDCVFTNCTATGSGGAVNVGDYVRCSFYDCKTSSELTYQGGGAVAGAGFCTDCTFIGCETTGASGVHGAAIYNVKALTNCTFRSCKANANELIGVAKASVSYPIVNCTFENNETPTLLSGYSCILNTKIVGNTLTGQIAYGSADNVVANTLVVSNACTVKAQGIFANGQFVNCTFIGNFCTSGRASDSILGESCVAINCLFYKNKAHSDTYNDMAMRCTDNTLATPLSPYLTNCVWSAEVTYNDAHKTAAYARTANSQLDASLTLNLTGASDAPYYTLGRSDFARRGGLVTDEIRAILGTRDLAGNQRFGGSVANPTISLGCYQHQEVGFMMIIR